MGSQFDVIIVGGGAAGVGAARRLAAHGSSALLLESSSRLGGRAYTQDLGGYPLDLGCEWLHSGDRNAWVGIAEASGFPVDRSDPPWAKAHPGIAWDENDEEGARKAIGDWEEQLRAVAYDFTTAHGAHDSGQRAFGPDAVSEDETRSSPRGCERPGSDLSRGRAEP